MSVKHESKRKIFLVMCYSEDGEKLLSCWGAYEKEHDAERICMKKNLYEEEFHPSSDILYKTIVVEMERSEI